MDRPAQERAGTEHCLEQGDVAEVSRAYDLLPLFPGVLLATVSKNTAWVCFVGCAERDWLIMLAADAFVSV